MNDDRLFDMDTEQGIALRERELVMFDHGETHTIPYTLLGQDSMNKGQLLERLSDLQAFFFRY